MNAQISPLILSPPVLLNLVVRPFRSLNPTLRPEIKPFFPACARVAQVVAPHKTAKKQTNTQKGLGDGKQGLHIKAPVCLTFNPRL